MPKAAVIEDVAETAPDYETPNQTIASFLRFYNPGQDINERWGYDNPFKSSERTGELQAVAYYPINVRQGQFFNIPTAMRVTNAMGEEMTANIQGVFNSIMAQYREHGFVLVESPISKNRINDPNVAETDAEAKALGDSLWMDFLRSKANEWIDIVQGAKNMGAVPRSATGLFKHALNRLGIADPANNVQVIEHERKSGNQAREDIETIATLKAQNADMQRRMDEFMAKFNTIPSETK